ncbi:Small subunit processome component [Globomyces sp. JEL0801]|nr:Small subunit processome component [Globomyces sp. JEL0801]
MKLKRQKKTKRNMAIYNHSFGFRAPYQILLDGNFIQVARLTGKQLDQVLPQFLSNQVKLMTTYCVYAELKKLGPDVRPSAAFAKKLEKRRCQHSPAVPASQCLKEIIGETNQFNYCIATQDLELRNQLRLIPGIPLMYINKSVLILEPASKATMDKVQENELKKTLPKPFEKIKKDDGDVVEIKKRKVKGVNPLSMKKKKVEKVGKKTVGEEKKKRPRTRKKKVDQADSGDATNDTKLIPTSVE